MGARLTSFTETAARVLEVMTTLASIDAVRFSCSSRSGGTFSPVVLIGGDHPMTGNGPTTAAAAGGSSGSSISNSNSSINVGGGTRSKRELEVGNEEQPPPPKRMSPIPPRGQDPATRDIHTPMMDPSRSGDPTCDLNLGTAVAAAVFSPADGTTIKATTRGMPPRGRSRQSLPFSSDGLHPHPRELAAQSIGRAHTTSPPKADAVETIAPPTSTRPVRSMNCLISPPPKLRENVPSTSASGDLITRLSSLAAPEPRGGVGSVGEGGGGAGTYVSAPSTTSSMLAGHRRDVLKPSPQQNAGIKCSLDGTRGTSSRGSKEGHVSAATAIGSVGGERDDDGGIRGGWGCRESKGPESSKFSTEDESPGGSRRSMKRPLGGGLRASSSWDGGSASNAPPGTGGGFSAAPACRSCGGAGVGGRGSLTDIGQGEDDPQGEACSCKGLRTSLCLSPLPFFRTNSLEIGAQDTRRHGVGDDELFLLSHAFGPPTSPSAGPQDSRGGDGGGGDAVGTGVGGSGTDGFEMLVPSEGIQGMADDDIPDCMQTLLGSPPRDERAPPGHDHISFGGTSFDEAASQGDGIHGTGGGGNDETSNRNGEMDVESARGSRTDSGNFSDGEMDSTSTGTSVGRSGAPGPKVGVNHQAVVPALSTLKRKGDSRSSPERSPPLQLWRPGTVSDAAAIYAFPTPQPNGAGSSELEQKLLGAYLIHEAEKEALTQRRRCGGAAATTTAPGGPSSDGGGLGLQSAGAVGGAAAHGSGVGGGNFSDSGGSGGGGSNAEQVPSSVESLSKLVAVGEGAGWRTDWPASDREKFRTGVYAFRRDFHRIRAKFLPHRTHGDVVDYFYRRWKRDPEYPEWKCTEQLVGRRVAKVVEEGFGTMRRGWVSCKELDSRGGLDMQYRVVFPRFLHFEAYSKTFDLGTIETMLVEGFVTEEEKQAEEAASRPRVASSLSGARAAASGLHHSVDVGAGGTGGSSGGHAGGMLGAGLGAGLNGRRLGWNAHAETRYQYATAGLRHGRVGQGRGNQDSGGEDSGRTTRTMHDDDKRGEGEEEEEEEAGGNDRDGDDVGSGSGSGTSDSGPDAETDSTTSVSAGGNGESPVSTSSACFAEPPKEGDGSMVPQSPQQQQLSLQLTQELAQESSSSSTAPYSPIRTSTSSTQQQEQQRLLLQTPPLLPPADETLRSGDAVERRWADVEGFAVDKGVDGSPLLSSATSATGLGGHHGVGEDGDASTAAGSTGAAQFPSR